MAKDTKDRRPTQAQTEAEQIARNKAEGNQGYAEGTDPTTAGLETKGKAKKD